MKLQFVPLLIMLATVTSCYELEFDPTEDQFTLGDRGSLSFYVWALSSKSDLGSPLPLLRSEDGGYYPSFIHATSAMGADAMVPGNYEFISEDPSIFEVSLVGCDTDSCSGFGCPGLNECGATAHTYDVQVVTKSEGTARLLVTDSSGALVDSTTIIVANNF